MEKQEAGKLSESDTRKIFKELYGTLGDGKQAANICTDFGTFSLSESERDRRLRLLDIKIKGFIEKFPRFDPSFLAPAVVLLKNKNKLDFGIFALRFDDFPDINNQKERLEWHEKHDKNNWKARLENVNGEKLPIRVESTGSISEFQFHFDSPSCEFSLKQEGHWAGGLVGKLLQKTDCLKYLGTLYRNDVKKDLYIVDFRRIATSGKGRGLAHLEWMIDQTNKHSEFHLATGNLTTELYKQ